MRRKTRPAPVRDCGLLVQPVRKRAKKILSAESLLSLLVRWVELVLWYFSKRARKAYMYENEGFMTLQRV
jgi:hypothetical protein